MKKKATIKNFRQVQIIKEFIVGEVYGHPSFTDGDAIRTGEIIRWIDDDTAETENTVYTVEDPLP